MKVIVVLDKNLGMAFNNRRQSRDRKLTKNIVEYIGNEKLYIEKYSEPLFANTTCNYFVVDSPLNVAKESNYYFIERSHIEKFVKDINELVIYHWNRSYPHDFDFNMNLENSNFKKISAIDFQGFSHEKIIKEVYVKWKKYYQFLY